MTNINDQDISHLLLDTISRLTVLIEGWELDISYNNGHLDSSWISAKLDVGQTHEQACSIYQLLQQKIVAVHESQAQYYSHVSRTGLA